MQDISAEVQGNYESEEGLRIKDFPELKIKNGEAIFKKTPTMVIVRIQILKKFVLTSKDLLNGFSEAMLLISALESGQMRKERQSRRNNSQF